MEIAEFATKYNMHDSLIDDLSFSNNVLNMTIDFAFWMQNWYVPGSPETAPLRLTFKNVSLYQCADDIPLDKVSILDTSFENNIFKFSLINDMTDEYLEIIIVASEVIVE